jgi:hypothetical protein
MRSDSTRATAPKTLSEFLTWLCDRQSELSSHWERPIGGSGKTWAPTGKHRDDPGSPTAEVNLYQPSNEYLVWRTFLDRVVSLCSATLATEFFATPQFARIRNPEHARVLELREAMKWVEAKIRGEPDMTKKADQPEFEQATSALESTTSQITKKAASIETRVKLGGANVVLLDGQPVSVKPNGYRLFELLLEVRGEYVPITSHGLRTRDVETLPTSLRDAVESNPGAGTRLKREYVV